MDLEPSRPVNGFTVAVWQRGEFSFLKGTQAVYPLNVRHQVSVFCWP